MDTPQEKICTKCGLSKSLDEFRDNSTKASGKQSQCKTCEHIYHVAYKDKPKKVVEEKTCTKCGMSKPINQFTKDLGSPDGKKYACKTCVAAIDAARCDMPKVVPLKKVCTKCREIKVINEFSSNMSRKDGHNSRCKSCENRDSAIYRANNGDKARAATRRWNAAHPDDRHLHWHNREARRRKLPDTWTMQQIIFMLDYWQHACAICGNSRGFFWKLSHDHWIPLMSPNCPGTVVTNMVPLCLGSGGCNNSKGDREPHQWLVWRFGKKKAAVIERKIAAYFVLVAQTFPQSDHSKGPSNARVNCAATMPATGKLSV